MLKNFKIPYIKYIPILFVAIVMFKAIDRVDLFIDFVAKLFNLLIPLFWAGAIAYLVNPVMKFIEKRFKMRRLLSLLIVYSLVIGLLTMSIVVITPRIIESINDILLKSNDYYETAYNYVITTVEDLEEQSLFGLSSNINTENIEKLLNNFLSFFNLMWNALMTSLISITSGLFKIVIGLIISVYILKDKEKFANTCRKSTYAFLPEEKATRFLLFIKEIDDIFSRYIVGKLVDSLIIGIMCYIGLSVLNTPYALLLAIIVGLTNMIPYFGPFIGMVPAVIITLFKSPMLALWVGIFIFLLQQFDGYYLGPKILGDSVGISPFWIILGIILGGGFFGVLGMLLAVPIVAVLLTLYNREVDRRIEQKDLYFD